MPITALTPVQRAAVRSTVALKALMAGTGLIMIGYLLAHMYGNLKIFAGPAAFNGYAHHLRTIGEPILPHTGLLWIIRVVLVLSVIGHMTAAFLLWSRANKATAAPDGSRRYISTRARTGVQRTYSSFTLRWGGVVILLFVVYHLLHLTFNVIRPGGPADTPYGRVVAGFQVWWVLAAYTIAMIAIGFHLRHGTWGAFMTLGANTSPIARRRLNRLAYAVAAIVTIGFLVPPYCIFFGLVR